MGDFVKELYHISPNLGCRQRKVRISELARLLPGYIGAVFRRICPPGKNEKQVAQAVEITNDPLRNTIFCRSCQSYDAPFYSAADRPRQMQLRRGCRTAW